jgi:hypothetical protein
LPSRCNLLSNTATIRSLPLMKRRKIIGRTCRSAPDMLVRIAISITQNWSRERSVLTVLTERVRSAKESVVPSAAVADCVLKREV